MLYEVITAYNEEVIDKYPIKVTIEKDRSPFIVGYGFGLRSKVFGFV